MVFVYETCPVCTGVPTNSTKFMKYINKFNLYFKVINYKL